MRFTYKTLILLAVCALASACASGSYVNESYSASSISSVAGADGSIFSSHNF